MYKVDIYEQETRYKGVSQNSECCCSMYNGPVGDTVHSQMGTPDVPTPDVPNQMFLIGTTRALPIPTESSKRT